MNKMNLKSDWWEPPSDNDIYQLAQITTKYIRFLNPKIVKAITEENKKHHDDWRKLLKQKKVNPELYLWDKSPCCFPGVRRYTNSEKKNFRKRKGKNALRLDDNDFPKHIWSFILNGEEFKIKRGKNVYVLAHLFDTKKYKNRMEIELDFPKGEKFSEPYFGLFTCPTNTIYIPDELSAPTDYNPSFRRLLFQKAESLIRIIATYCLLLLRYQSLKMKNGI